MRKIIIITLLVILGVTGCKSPNSGWKETFYTADEMKGTGNYIMQSYKNKEGDAFICFSNSNEFQIYTHEGIFWTNDFGFNRASVGLYKNGELLNKISSMLFVNRNKASDIAIASTLDPDSNSTLILNHLKNVGDVRFIITRFQDTDFDFVVPMNPNLKYKSE